MNQQSPAYLLTSAFYSYIKYGNSRKELGEEVRTILAGLGYGPGPEMDACMAVLAAQPAYIDLQDYFPDMPSSWC